MNKATPKSEVQPAQARNTKRHLVIELPETWVVLGPNTFAIPLEPMPHLFHTNALEEVTKGINPGVVDVICENFIKDIQKQKIMSQLQTHEEELEVGSNG